MNDPLEWYTEIPIVSRVYLTAAFLTTAACALDLVSPYSLYFNLKLIMQGQVRPSHRFRLLSRPHACVFLRLSLSVFSLSLDLETLHELPLLWDVLARLPVPFIFPVSSPCEIFKNRRMLFERAASSK